MLGTRSRLAPTPHQPAPAGCWSALLGCWRSVCPLWLLVWCFCLTRLFPLRFLSCLRCARLPAQCGSQSCQPVCSSCGFARRGSVRCLLRRGGLSRPALAFLPFSCSFLALCFSSVPACPCLCVGALWFVVWCLCQTRVSRLRFLSCLRSACLPAMCGSSSI